MVDRSGAIFCLDFISALLANIVHAPSTQIALSQPSELASTTRIIGNLLNLIYDEKIPASVLMDILISLSYLNKGEFAQVAEGRCQFSDRIADFVEVFSKKDVGENENDEIDKRTVLDLCAHMFHPRDFTGNADISSSVEYNDMK